MTCSCEQANVSFVEQAVRQDFLPPSMQGWRCYRIEYGFECSCPEGIIYLPPLGDTDELEDWIANEQSIHDVLHSS